MNVNPWSQSKDLVMQLNPWKGLLVSHGGEMSHGLEKSMRILVN